MRKSIIIFFLLINPFICVFGQTPAIELTCPDSVQMDCGTTLPESFTFLTQLIYAGGRTESSCDINIASFSLYSETLDTINCPTIVTRTYEVKDICGNQGFCDHKIYLSPATSSKGIFQINNFKVLPNPCRSSFEVILPDLPSDPIQISLLSNSGQIVESRKIPAHSQFHKEQFNVSNLKAGTYYVIVSGGGSRKSRQLIIR